VWRRGPLTMAESAARTLGPLHVRRFDVRVTVACADLCTHADLPRGAVTTPRAGELEGGTEWDDAGHVTGEPSRCFGCGGGVRRGQGTGRRGRGAA
jgi:hypothetical protein